MTTFSRKHMNWGQHSSHVDFYWLFGKVCFDRCVQTSPNVQLTTGEKGMTTNRRAFCLQRGDLLVITTERKVDKEKTSNVPPWLKLGASGDGRRGRVWIWVHGWRFHPIDPNATGYSAYDASRNIKCEATPLRTKPFVMRIARKSKSEKLRAHCVWQKATVNWKLGLSPEQLTSKVMTPCVAKCQGKWQTWSSQERAV